MHPYVLIKSAIRISLNLQQSKTRLIHDSGYYRANILNQYHIKQTLNLSCILVLKPGIDFIDICFTPYMLAPYITDQYIRKK